MRIPPLSVLLTWPVPNYVDPVTRGNASLIVNIIFILLVVLVVGLRFYCRMSAGALRFGWDDGMIALALVLYRFNSWPCWSADFASLSRSVSLLSSYWRTNVMGGIAMSGIYPPKRSLKPTSSLSSRSSSSHSQRPLPGFRYALSTTG